MAEQFGIRIIWVPGHIDMLENTRRGELARMDTSLQFPPLRLAMNSREKLLLVPAIADH